MSSILLLTLCASVAVGMPPPLSSVTLPPDVPDIPDLSSSTCNCELQFCMPVSNCANGYIAKDSCNCCDVCIKIQAMAKCGHRADSVGKCGPGLLCKVRHPHSMENEILPPDEKVGRCEPVACKNMECGKHQWCTVEKNKPKCACHLACHLEREDPVCGLHNGKPYRNRCAVRADECQHQKLIDYVPGPCKKCSFGGEKYDYGKVIPGGEPCEHCVCKHGKWECQFDVKCLKDKFYKGYECTGPTNLHDEIICREGYKCRITKLNNGISGVPHLGICEKLTAEKTCGIRPEAGSCFGFFESWYFNAKEGVCKIFIYGGCGGNDNRFDTEEKCMKLCKEFKAPLITTPQQPKPLLPDIEVPTMPILPDEQDNSKISKIPHIPSQPAPKVPDMPELPKPSTVHGPDKTVKPIVRIAPNVPKTAKMEESPEIQSLPGASGPNIQLIPEKPNSEMPIIPKIPTLPNGEEPSYDAQGAPDFEQKRASAGLADDVTQTAVVSGSIVRDSANVCKVDGETHDVGKAFLRKDCSSTCICNSQRSYECVSLCPPSTVTCPAGMQSVVKAVPVAGSPKCFCQQATCIKSKTCEIQGKIHEVNKPFISGNCTGRCICKSPSEYSCVSLCPPSRMKCPSGFQVKYSDIPVPSSDGCTCPRPKCVKKDLKKSICSLFGKKYNIGDKFTNPDCSGMCKCTGNNKIECVSLCPPVIVKCSANERLANMIVPAFKGSECTCTVPECVPENVSIDKNGFRQVPVSPMKDVETIDEEGGDETTGGKVDRKPQYGKEDLRIHGKVIFKKSPGKLPSHSCLRVVFEDVSLADQGSVVYKTEEFNVSNADINAHYMYEFKTKKPKENHEFYAISAVLNVGWCADEDGYDWIRNFDFLSDTTLYVPLSKGVTDYEVDVPVVFYCRGAKCPQTEKIQMAPEAAIAPSVIEMGQLPPRPERSNGMTPLADAEKHKLEEYEHGDDWPYGGEQANREPKYAPILVVKDVLKHLPDMDKGNGTLTIHGKATFDKAPGKLPQKSCLRLLFQDISIADASSVLYKEEIIDLSDVEVGDVLKYKIKSRKPQMPNSFFSVSAILNVGWCAKTGTHPWIKVNDYLTDTSFYVDLTKEENDYIRDIGITYYGDHGHKTADTSPMEEGSDLKVRKAAMPQHSPKSGNCLKETVAVSSINEETLLEAMKGHFKFKELFQSIPEKYSMERIAENEGPISIEMPDIKKGSIGSFEGIEEGELIFTQGLQNMSGGDYTDNRKPVYGEKNISIHGSIKFDIKPGKLPKPSCMKIFLEDISLQDVNSVLYHESQYDLSGKTLEETFEYSLKTRKPRDMKYTYYSLSVVLNVGWCPDKNSKLWVRNNDYLSDVTVKVQLEEDQHDYEINVPAVYYCRGSLCRHSPEERKPTPPVYKPTAEKAPSLFAIQSLQKNREPVISEKTSNQGIPQVGDLSLKITPFTVLDKLPPVLKCIDHATKKIYKPGDEWYGDDDCMHCTCSADGLTVCATPMCDLPFCKTGPALKTKGRCCPICPEDRTCKTEKGRTRVAYKERWQQADCKVCECTKDGIKCVDPTTKKQNCAYPGHWNGRCTPICIDDVMPPRQIEEPKGCIKPNGVFAPFSSSWKTNNCTICRCNKDYGVRCQKDCTFSKDNCEKSIDLPGKCCPVCLLKKCQFDNWHYSQGEKITREDGTACQCQRGEWLCTGKEHATCKDSSGKDYQLGESRLEDCNTCICSGKGRWACTAIACQTKPLKDDADLLDLP